MKKILLFIMVAWVMSISSLYAQDRVISGKITSAEDGAPLPGVNILAKGTTIGTVTDSNGAYSINVPQSANVLTFSFIGFKTTDVDITGRTSVDTSLEMDAAQLSEVIVVGYGTQLKQDVTGNIAKVSGEAIQNVPVTSFEQALQGRAAGVLITSQNGKVGQGINIRIRGSSSVSAGNEPLYVVDGMVINADNLSSNDAATNPLADINFNDIQSVEILKDASASALYGSRGANGVVLITTKKGKIGKTNFTANFQYGSSKPTGHRKFLNAAQYVELMRESAYNNDLADGIDPINNPTTDYDDSWLQYMEDELDFLAGDTDWRNLETDTDWEKEAFQKANFSSFDLNGSGGNEKTTFYFSGGFTDQDGILINNGFKRFSGRVNIEHKATDKLSFGINVSISKTLNKRLSTDNDFSTPLQLVAQAPITPVRDKQGNLYDDAINPAMFYYPATVERENASFTTSVFRNIGSVFATYKLTNDLHVTGEYGFDILTQQEDRYWNELTQSGRGDVQGYGQSRWVQLFNNTGRVLVGWDKTIDKHIFNITAGTEYQFKTNNSTNIEAQGFPVKELKKIVSASEYVRGSSNLVEEYFLSYFARANYKFNDKYLFNISGRIDGSSRFGPSNKYGFFPAASAGWIISQEGFLADAKTISMLKLRASYGLVGNAAIDNYKHLALYEAATYGGSPGLTPKQIANPDLSWEKTTQLDIGIDFGFFNDRLTGEIDYYNKQTTDLLFDTPVPSTSGFTTQFRNVGELENKGIELVLNYTVVRTADLTISIGGNYAANRNKITKLDGLQTRIDPGSSRYMNVAMVGQPIGVFFGREYAGVNPDNGDALWFINRTPSQEEIDEELAFTVDGMFGNKFVTNNFTVANSVVIGNPTPKANYGFNLDVKFKGFDLSVLFQGVYGNKIYNAAGGFMSANGRYEDTSTIDQLDRWQEPGDITMIPQARLYANNGAQASSRFLYDGSYLRLKTVTLGYNFPGSLTSKISLTSLRLYVSGQNLATFTSYPGWDPEVNTDFLASNIFLSNDFYAAPQAKNLIVGIKVGF